MNENNNAPQNELNDDRTAAGDGLGGARRAFNIFGFAFFAMAVIEYALSYGLVFLGNRFFPEAAATEWFFWLRGSAVIYLFAMPAAWLIMRRLPRRELAEPMPDGSRCKPKKLGGYDFFIAMLMALGIMQLGNLVSVLINAIMLTASGRTSASGLDTVMLNLNPVAIFAFVVVIGPLMEELIFRKLIIDRLSEYGALLSAVMSAMTFGLFHGNLQQYFYAFAVGLFLAFIYIRTRNIRTTVLMHMTLNLVGGFIPSMLLRLIGGTEGLNDIIMRLSGDESDVIGALVDFMGPLMAVYAWSLTLMGLGIVGICLLVSERKKFTFAPCRPAGTPIPRQKRGEVIFLNAGMLLFIAAMAAVLALSFIA